MGVGDQGQPETVAFLIEGLKMRGAKSGSVDFHANLRLHHRVAQEVAYKLCLRLRL